MLESSVFAVALLAVIFDPSMAQTAQDCANEVKSRLQSLQDKGDSIRDNMCDLNQEHAKCVYTVETRRRSDEETAEFVKLVEDALRQADEPGQICEVDFNAIMEETAKVEKCTDDFGQIINEMARRGSAVSKEEYCKEKNAVINCVLDAIDRRPSQPEVNKYAELLNDAEMQAGVKCDIDLNAMIDEYLKKKSEGKDRNGGIGVIYRGSTLIWLVFVSVIAHSLVNGQFS